MAFSIGWLLDKLGQKIYAWSTTNSVMDFDRGGETGQTLQKTLDDLESSKGDMRKDVFATNGKPGVVDNAVNGINTYIHSKQGTVHNFQGEGSNGKALMTANFEEGDSITVNGTPVTAYIGTDEAVTSMAGNEWNGKWITFTFEGNTLNFKGGGGGKVTVSGLSAEKILSDTTVEIAQGSKIIQSVTGIIPIKTETQLSIPMFSTEPILLPKGYYDKDVTVIPTYVSSTAFTDFSATGYFGSAKAFHWGGSNNSILNSATATTSGVYIKQTCTPEAEGVAGYGGCAIMAFQTPFAHDYDYAIVTYSGSGFCYFEKTPRTSFPRWTQISNNLSGGSTRINYSKDTPYLLIGTNTGTTGDWWNSSSEIRVTKITFYKNA